MSLSCILFQEAHRFLLLLKAVFYYHSNYCKYTGMQYVFAYWSSNQEEYY